ncbi:EscU/YscU/HrcU family type III secretion system export apparatus switch protein [Aurantiacibacter xanthus]|uniref:EscU/YscU/HrcU family type III secretion system export apparatus switch protein n=1 Tax=Aurantiacibacter xanthus TaxID=1784712 RepID=A0A3A1P565_9SPHN|nr:EscU/YscU/HrcU family type III secretion system export apparatus switch protein [Aurantiacibacter xanthus]RIV81325.1 EscU/YscU/HrcU family type III secretion system export apparatus switch protein [Aurantiacibacter xanthus]
MSGESSGEKTFAPTARKRREAAKQGDVLRSKELATAATMIAGLAWMIMAGPWVLDELRKLVITALTFDANSLERGGAGDVLAIIPDVAVPVVILGLMVPAASLVAQLSFGEGRWVAENLQFKAKRINPMTGLKRIFGPQGWIEMGKGLIKVALLGTIAFVWMKMTLPDISDLGRATLARQLEIAWSAAISLIASLAGGLVVIALIDLPIQWLRRDQRLKMTHQEMRDENKESEGSPETKSARRQRQREIAMGALGPAMKDAQFVITNPTHFSVALVYDPEKAGAPIVLAKGRGEKALAIREVAADMQIPVLEYPPLARSLYYTTRERQVIREELYAAVAAIVAFVLSIRRGETPPLPRVSVPVEMQFDAEGRTSA